MRTKRLGIMVLVLIACAVLPESPATHGGGSPAALVCPSPPEGLELPIGQALEIRCHLAAEASATLDFWADDRWLCSRQVLPGGLAATAWQPEEAGSHVLAVTVRGGARNPPAAARRVVVLPAGAPVRIP